MAHKDNTSEASHFEEKDRFDDGKKLLADLKHAQTADEIIHALKSIAQVINGRVWVKTGVSNADAYEAGGKFKGSLGAATSGQRLFYDPDTKILRFPGESFILSFELQKAFCEIFTDRVQMDRPVRPENYEGKFGPLLWIDLNDERL